MEESNTAFFDNFPSSSISFGDLMETVKSLWLTLEINNNTTLNLLTSSVLLKTQFTFYRYIDSLSGAELFR